MTTRHFLIALLLVVCTFSFHNVKAQGTATLHVADMPGYPDLPQDTAYEQNTYNFDINLVNGTNLIINSSVTIMLKVDTTFATLVNNPAMAINPGDSISISIAGYNFSPSQYKAGNNIVVVWPVVNGLVLPVDSFITNVHFVPLTSVDGIDLNEPVFNMFPVPANTTLNLDFGKSILVEQVRIYSASGQLVRTCRSTGKNEIDISSLDSGLYFVEAIFNGVAVRKKFVKY